MSSTPGSAIGSTSRPRASTPWSAGGREQVVGGGPDRVVAAEPEADAAEVGLVGEADGVELERDGTPAERPAASTAASASATATAA